MPVRRKEISKPGGVRLLGIPTVLDRVIQQAVAQIFNRVWNHTFSEYSFGFRPKRSQHDAIRKYREYVQSGLRIVLDELDKELQKRGLCFVRYADDCVIFVGSKRAGDRVMESVNSGCVKLPPAAVGVVSLR